MRVKQQREQNLFLQVTDGLEVAVIPSTDHEFLMPTKEVAKGYGVNINALSNIKRRNPNEFVENKHFITTITVCDKGKPPIKETPWTKRGIVRLGFFIKSERAKLFRDWAEDLVIHVTNPDRVLNPVRVDDPLDGLLEIALEARTVNMRRRLYNQYLEIKKHTEQLEAMRPDAVKWQKWIDKKKKSPELTGRA